MKIVNIDRIYLVPKHLQELKKISSFIFYKDNPHNIFEAIRRIKDADIVINFWYDMPASLIKAASCLKMICVAAVGHDWIDIKEAKKRKILVCNCPGHSAEAVAEHTVGLMLNAMRLVSQAQGDQKNNHWLPLKYKGKELKNRILGIIGYGNIGKRVAEICQKGFNMKIIYINSQSSKKDLEQLLSISDVISINAPLTEKTKNMLGEKEFSLMKKGVVIINTGRGQIIKEDVFIRYLKNGTIFAAGLDVLAKEPVKSTDAILSLSNVITTPHMAFNTEESEYRLSQMVVNNIKQYLIGKPQNIVT